MLLEPRSYITNRLNTCAILFSKFAFYFAGTAFTQVTKVNKLERTEWDR